MLIKITRSNMNNNKINVAETLTVKIQVIKKTNNEIKNHVSELIK